MGRPEAKPEAHAETDDIDFEWDETFGVMPAKPSTDSSPPPHPESGAIRSARPIAFEELPERGDRPREAMITLPDDDPLRHDVGYTKDRDVTRDSMPTIPDINPLRHDVPELSAPELASSGSAGGRGRA
jgi:hypothetical protein